MLKISFQDKSKSVIARVQKLSSETPAKWTPDQEKTFKKIMKNLMEDTKDWIILTQAAEDGAFVISPGFKLELVDRILKGEVELTASKEDDLVSG